MVARMEQDPSIGILAPKVLHFDGRVQDTCHPFPRWFMPFVQRTSLRTTAWGKRYADEYAMTGYDHMTPMNVDWVQGSALFLRAETWWLLDGFDRRFWMYFEDVDVCRRTHLLGKKVWYDPSLVLQHAHGKISGRIRNYLVNILTVKETRGHIVSWVKYNAKWFGKSDPEKYPS
jgi:GT2 family glycosyltransferase